MAEWVVGLLAFVATVGLGVWAVWMAHQKRHVQKADPESRAALCQTCLDRARLAGVETVYVYSNGHMLRPAGLTPSLAEWPRVSDVDTFCGLNVYGMGESMRYRLDGPAAVRAQAAEGEGQ